MTKASFGEEIVQYISIHTPARGVTLFSDVHSMFMDISIHTPARGVTDHMVECTWSRWISIHTPARGVTCDQR